MAQQELKPGFIEYWSGRLLRVLMAYLFVVGVPFFFLSVVTLNPTVVYGGLLMLPYLVIRWRDPEVSTVPLADRARAALD
jgi:hypothetical protein